MTLLTSTLERMQPRAARAGQTQAIVAMSVVACVYAVLSALDMGILAFLLTLVVLLILVCLRIPYLAVVVFVASSFFIPPDLNAGGVPLHLGDFGFLLIGVTFALREGYKLDLKIPRQPLVAASLLVAIIAGVAAVNGYLSGNNPTLIPGDLRTLIYYLLVWPIATFLNDTETRQKTMLLLAPMAIAGVLWGIWQDTQNPGLFGYSVSIGGVNFGRLVAPLMPTFLPMIFGLLTLVLLMCGQKRGRTLLMATLAICLIGLFLTLTRGAILGFVVGAAAVNFVSGSRLFSWRKMTIVAVLLGSVGWVVDSSTNHVFSGRLTETSSQDQNVASRLYESGVVLGKIVERPIFGSGLGALHSPDQPMSPDQNTSTRYYLNPTYVHNFYLWAWFKLGLAGIVCFISLIIAAVKAGARAHRSTSAADDKALGLAVVAVMAAIAINSVTSPLFNDEFTVPSIVFVLGLCSATLKASASAHSRNYLHLRQSA